MTRLRKEFRFWRGMLTLVVTLYGAQPAIAQCLDPLGDLNLDASTNVVDVQCSILSTLWTLSGGEPSEAPNCIFDDPSRADVNCVEGVNPLWGNLWPRPWMKMGVVVPMHVKRT